MNKASKKAKTASKSVANRETLRRVITGSTLKEIPKTKGKASHLRIDSKSILRKKNGEYLLNKYDLKWLMNTLVNQVELHNRAKGPSQSVEITKFSIDIEYVYGGKVDMRQMVDGSHANAWKRKGE